MNNPVATTPRAPGSRNNWTSKHITLAGYTLSQKDLIDVSTASGAPENRPKGLGWATCEEVGKALGLGRRAAGDILKRLVGRRQWEEYRGTKRVNGLNRKVTYFRPVSARRTTDKNEQQS